MKNTLKSHIILSVVFKYNFVFCCLFLATCFWTSAFANTAEISLTIKSLKAKSTDACNEKMDFYAITSIDNKRKKRTRVKEGNFIKPLWKNKEKVSASGRKKIFIEIMDEDDTFCGGGDDVVDVSPLAENKLLLYIDMKTLKIYNSKNRPVGSAGRDITLSGSSYRRTPMPGGNIETGSITFRVNIKKYGSSAQKLTLTVASLQAKSKDSCNEKMDFYAKLKIGNNRTYKTSIKEGNYIRPNWRNSATITGKTRVLVEIWDEDDSFCGGGDDKVDVNPNRDNFLYLYVDPVSRNIYRDKNYRVKIGRIGETITMEGNTYSESIGSEANIERGKIKFKFDLR